MRKVVVSYYLSNINTLWKVSISPVRRLIYLQEVMTNFLGNMISTNQKQVGTFHFYLDTELNARLLVLVIVYRSAYKVREYRGTAVIGDIHSSFNICYELNALPNTCQQ